MLSLVVTGLLSALASGDNMPSPLEMPLRDGLQLQLPLGGGKKMGKGAAGDEPDSGPGGEAETAKFWRLRCWRRGSLQALPFPVAGASVQPGLS